MKVKMGARMLPLTLPCLVEMLIALGITKAVIFFSMAIMSAKAMMTCIGDECLTDNASGRRLRL